MRKEINYYEVLETALDECGCPDCVMGDLNIDGIRRRHYPERLDRFRQNLRSDRVGKQVRGSNLKLVRKVVAA